jgi:dipeptidyl aminopeptidase/acylaminoacyl peptidase
MFLSRPRHRGAVCLTLGLVVGLLSAHGQAGRLDPSASGPAWASPQPGAAAESSRAMEPADILDWKTIGPAALSADGRWVAYRYSPVQGDSLVIVRATTGEKEYRFPIGELPPAQPTPPGGPQAGPPGAGGPGVSFSDDGKWAAFSIYPLRKDAERLRKQKKPIQTKARLVNLETGAEIDYPKVRRFEFSGESSLALALHRYGPEGGGKDKPKGADLIVRDLVSGTDLTIGGVAELSFDKPGARLAWTIDVDEQIGNGVSVRDLKTGAVTTLDSGKASYEKPTWNEAGTALAVLKGVDDKGYEEKRYAVIGITDFSAATPRKVVYDPAKDTAFPAGMTISANRAPEWTVDRGGLLFGLADAKKKEGAAEAPAASGDKEASAGDAAKPADEADADDKPDLVLWHWKDGRLQTQQQVQEDRDKRFSYLATYRVAEQKFLRLADDDLREVTPPKQGRWAMGVQRRPYELTGALEGRSYQDVYLVDLETGARKLAARQVRWTFGQSPDSTKVLYYDAGHFHVFDAVSGQSTNITKGAPVSFVDVEDDHNVVQPPVNPEGWAADSRSVLLSDAWDIWQAPVAGGAAVNLTGNGRRDQIRYDRVSEPDEKGIDLAKPQYFLTLGEWTKKGGIARVLPGKPGAETLAFDAAGYSRLLKAKRADTLIYTRETNADYPDIHVAGAALDGARRISNGQAQLASFAWSSGVKLLDYTSTAPSSKVKGKKLQGALFLPANYQPGRSYPTIVYIYERLSDGLNRFAQPTANGFNKSVYTSQGYAVLMPDITYTVNDPGMSAVWSVLPALKAAVATGIVDPARVGLQGHSWGGYQTSFLVTQTHAFKAAIAGAPLTNMVSMYSLVYKNSGGGNMAIFESSQGRFKGGYWDNWDAYVRNSPIAHATKVTTPLVILHNDRDGAVDFTQGVEYYNTLRRLGKPVVMLEYVGENHGLVRAANRFDYTVRMKEFFDAYLKGAPAPSWWTDGVPRLDMDKHLRTRQPKPKKSPSPASPTTTTAAGSR